MSRALLQQLFIRVCRDSGFTLDWVRAAILTAKIADTDPLLVWLAMDVSTMERIASGAHPAAVKPI
jgi:hypothetical protein